MFVELHILQNFAPSNLNRDDTGSPKDCEFGGYRRARISSQCFKRAIRTAARDGQMLAADHFATRTKRLIEKQLVPRLKQLGKVESEAQAVAVAALGGLGLTVKDDGKTEFLLYLGASEIEAIVSLCVQHWDTFLASALAPDSSADEPVQVGRKSGKSAKKAAKEAVPVKIVSELKQALDGSKAVDLALFGRMIAGLEERKVDAACQVAHALSTNRVSKEFDFYTAVDDLKPDDTPGADMLGTVEFNSACFYRYANVDLVQLVHNLGGDEELARAALGAFLRASISAVPNGKQNSMAAQNPPSFVFAVARDAGLWSLANAFVKPVCAEWANGDLIAASIKALDDYWGKLTRMYAPENLRGQWVCLLDADGLHNLKPSAVDTIDKLVAEVLNAASCSNERGDRAGVVA